MKRDGSGQIIDDVTKGKQIPGISHWQGPVRIFSLPVSHVAKRYSRETFVAYFVKWVIW